MAKGSHSSVYNLEQIPLMQVHVLRICAVSYTHLEVLRQRSAHYVAVRTQDAEEAARLLERYCPKREHGWLLLENVSDAAVAQINQQLVCSGIQVYRIEERQRSLEEIFLDLTGKAGAL